MNIIKLIIFGIFAFFLASCTEIIDISTKDAEPQLVVEASIALNEPATVLLTKSIALNQPNNFERVEHATVTISDNTGKTEILSENKGVYTSQTIKGELGKTYTLTVQSGNRTITSQCKIPTRVPIDSFKVVNSIFPGAGPARGNQPAPFYNIKLSITDPADEDNFYRTLLYFNGKLDDSDNIFDDRFTNGDIKQIPIIFFNDTAQAGDTIGIELQCIDKQVYKYFASMANAMGPRNSSSPANPYTNLNGAILGYFSAHTVERKEWVLK